MILHLALGISSNTSAGFLQVVCEFQFREKKIFWKKGNMKSILKYDQESFLERCHGPSIPLIQNDMVLPIELKCKVTCMSLKLSSDKIEQPNFTSQSNDVTEKLGGIRTKGIHQASLTSLHLEGFVG